MRSKLQLLLLAYWLFGGSLPTVSHPSSGIVVNEQGEVFFVHSSRGVAKVDKGGRLTYIHPSTGGHWLCLDPKGSFSRTQPKSFARITADGVHPGIIFADG